MFVGLGFLRVGAVTICRRTCEHFAFMGAGIDFWGFLNHQEAAFIVGAGKAAFVVGSIGVYLLHAEEARREKALRDHRETEGVA